MAPTHSLDYNELVTIGNDELKEELELRGIHFRRNVPHARLAGLLLSDNVRRVQRAAAAAAAPADAAVDSSNARDTQETPVTLQDLSRSMLALTHLLQDSVFAPHETAPVQVHTLPDLQASIPDFSGRENESAKRWLEKLEKVSAQSKWSSETMMMVATGKMKRAAQHWQRADGVAFASYDEWKIAFLNRFEKPLTLFQWFRRINTMRQETQTVVEYLYAKREVLSQCPWKEMPAEHAVEFLLNGLKNDVVFQTLNTYALQCNHDVYSIVDYAQKLDIISQDRPCFESASQQHTARPTNRDKLDIAPQMEIKAARMDAKVFKYANTEKSPRGHSIKWHPGLPRETMQCFRCGEHGHVSMDCSKTRTNHVTQDYRRDDTGVVSKNTYCRTEPYAKSNSSTKKDEPQLSKVINNITLPSKSTIRPVVDAVINDEHVVDAYFDSGSDVSLLDYDTAKEIGVRIEPWTSTTLEQLDYSFVPDGQCDLYISVGKFNVRVTQVGIKKKLPYQLLLGNDWRNIANVVVSIMPNNDLKLFKADIAPEKKLLNCITRTDHRLRRMQDSDPYIAAVKEQVHSNKAPTQFVIEHDLLYRKSQSSNSQPKLQVVVPASIRRALIEQRHDDDGHMDAQRTLHKISSRYWWPKMYEDIASYVASCDVCQRYNHRTCPQFGFYAEVPTSTIPFETISMDHIGPLPRSSRGNVYILLAIDHATRFIVASAVPDTSANRVLKFLDQLTNQYGMPNAVITDKGSGFTSKTVETYFQENGIQHFRTPAYHHQSNELAERANGTVIHVMRKYLKSKPKQWDNLLASVIGYVNRSTNTSLRQMPFYLLYGYDPRFGQFDRNIAFENHDTRDAQIHSLHQTRQQSQLVQKSTQENRLTRLNAPRKSITYNVGDLVLYKIPRRSGKFSPYYNGPYKIVAAQGRALYDICPTNEPSRTVQCHVAQLKPYLNKSSSSAELYTRHYEHSPRRTYNEAVSFFGDFDLSDTDSSHSDCPEHDDKTHHPRSGTDLSSGRPCQAPTTPGATYRQV